MGWLYLIDSIFLYLETHPVLTSACVSVFGLALHFLYFTDFLSRTLVAAAFLGWFLLFLYNVYTNEIPTAIRPYVIIEIAVTSTIPIAIPLVGFVLLNALDPALYFQKENDGLPTDVALALFCFATAHWLLLVTCFRYNRPTSGLRLPQWTPDALCVYLALEMRHAWVYTWWFGIRKQKPAIAHLCDFGAIVSIISHNAVFYRQSEAANRRHHYNGEAAKKELFEDHKWRMSATSSAEVFSTAALYALWQFAMSVFPCVTLLKTRYYYGWWLLARVHSWFEANVQAAIVEPKKKKLKKKKEKKRKIKELERVALATATFKDSLDDCVEINGPFEVRSSDKASLVPVFKWAQDKDCVYLKVDVTDVASKQLQASVGRENMRFAAESHGKRYAFEIRFRFAVTPKTATYSLKRVPEFLFEKHTAGHWWPHLLTDAHKRKFKSQCQVSWDKFVDADEENEQLNAGGSHWPKMAMTAGTPPTQGAMPGADSSQFEQNDDNSDDEYVLQFGF